MFTALGKILVMSMEDVEELSSQDPDADGDVERTGLIILNYNKINCTQQLEGGATRATAHVSDRVHTVADVY